MKIGVVGTGNMGRSLGVLFAELGHEVFFGARDREKGKAAVALTGGRALHGSNSEAAQFGEVIVWTVRDVSARQVIDDLGRLAQKPVIDMSNAPSQVSVREGDGLSMAERLQAEMPEAHVVKAFNNFAIELFELAPSPLDRYGVNAFLASDSEDAKRTVAALARSIGTVPTDCGALKNSRILEGLGDLARLLIRSGHPLTVAMSVQDLPAPSVLRLGGRQPSSLR